MRRCCQSDGGSSSSPADVEGGPRRGTYRTAVGGKPGYIGGAIFCRRSRPPCSRRRPRLELGACDRQGGADRADTGERLFADPIAWVVTDPAIAFGATDRRAALTRSSRSGNLYLVRSQHQSGVTSLHAARKRGTEVTYGRGEIKSWSGR